MAEFLPLFPSGEKTTLIRFERIADETDKLIAEICRFLNVDDGYRSILSTAVLGESYSKDTIDEEEAAVLADYYRPHNQRLADLTGWDLSGWR